MKRIYHIAARTDIERARHSGHYAPATLLTEGFIHCAYLQQLESVATRYFQGQSNLTLLEIDPLLITAPIVDENLTVGQERYPHVYGPLPMSAVTAIRELTCRDDGMLELPCLVRGCGDS